MYFVVCISSVVYRSAALCRSPPVNVFWKKNVFYFKIIFILILYVSVQITINKLLLEDPWHDQKIPEKNLIVSVLHVQAVD